MTHQRACSLSGTKMKLAINIAKRVSSRPDRAEERYFVLVGVIKLLNW